MRLSIFALGKPMSRGSLWTMGVLLGLLLRVSPALAQTDTTPPLTASSLAGTQGENDWYTSGVNVSLVADDLESGVASINWKLDDDDWQREEFLGTLNRVQNPSFEDGWFFWIDKWDHPWAFPWDATYYRSWVSKFGSHSATVFIFDSGSYYWHNRSYYAVTTASETYTASVWIKTWELSGTGAYLEAWARNPSGPDQLLSGTSRLTGTNDWTRVSTTFVMPEGYTGVYLRLQAQASWGQVWWDGANFFEEEETGVEFAVGSSGEHTLEYYSLDHAGNQELPHQTINFKIDTSAPSNWQNFEAVETLNNHTFRCSIDVSDTTSGLDVSTAAYQYTYDGGVTWSDWLGDVTVLPNVDGSETVTITTGDLDFHDSNWDVGKAIRFRIWDLAGLQGVSPDQNLFGAWVKTTGGDVYSAGNISMSISGPDPGAEGVVIVSGSGVANFSSSQNWKIINYPALTKLSYAQWQGKFPTTTPLPQGRLPLVSGRYFAGSGDFVVDAQTIPNDLVSTPDLSAVIFVGGNLIINTDLEVQQTSVLLFIVGGSVRISKNVEVVEASFLLDDNIDTSYDGSPPQKQLVVSGLVGAGSLTLRRSLSGSKNRDDPAELFEYPARIINLAPYLGEGKISWREGR